MRIAFDSVALLSPLTGIGQYAFELARRLAADAAHDAEFFYAIGWSSEVRTSPLPAASSLFPWLRRIVPDSYRVSRFLQGYNFSLRPKRAKFDLYHEPNYLPFAFDGPVVTTVHDLSWIRFPEAHPVERVRAMDRFFEPGLRRTTLVLTDSEFVKRELIEVFGLAPERIAPIPLGVADAFRPRTAQETASVLQPLELVHGRYLLAVGTLEPRKNLRAALHAYQRLPASAQAAYPLVVAGMKGWRTDAIERQLAPLVASGRVRLTGYLSREDLAALIAGATALVYPSIYEGFGLPPLEAMACGVPTIVSDVASLPEVVGDTGLLVQPHDHEALADAMRQMIDAPELTAQLGARALARSRAFTWERCYRETVAAYEKARAG